MFKVILEQHWAEMASAGQMKVTHIVRSPKRCPAER